MAHSGPGTNEFSDQWLMLVEQFWRRAMILFSFSYAAQMNVPAGDTGFSFFYTAINNPGFVRVYDGLNGTGNILAEITCR